MHICIISDFFYPDKGGVETHMYNLAQCLLARGHKVIVVTGAFQERIGVRYLTNGLKVYHIPIIEMFRQTSYIELISHHTAILRQIWIREQIEIVHSHQAASILQMAATLIS